MCAHQVNYFHLILFNNNCYLFSFRFVSIIIQSRPILCSYPFFASWFKIFNTPHSCLVSFCRWATSIEPLYAFACNIFIRFANSADIWYREHHLYCDIAMHKSQSLHLILRPTLFKSLNLFKTIVVRMKLIENCLQECLQLSVKLYEKNQQ
jgi:hypothetical protein